MQGTDTRQQEFTGQGRRAMLIESDTLCPNRDFYMSSNDADRIMNPACFSPEIVQFIQDEQKFLKSVFVREEYECIIEVGCHAGHNARWLSELCSIYIGVDINPAAIECAKTVEQKPGKIEFFCASVENLLQILLPEANYPHRKVVLFPFNLLGNFINVKRLLAMLDIKGLDVAMSNFNTKSATTLGRYNYYINCFGGASIRVFDAEQGVLFKAGQCFQSIAFSPAYLAGVSRQMCGYHGATMPFSLYGDLFLLTK